MFPHNTCRRYILDKNKYDRQLVNYTIPRKIYYNKVSFVLVKLPYYMKDKIWNTHIPDGFFPSIT